MKYMEKKFSIGKSTCHGCSQRDVWLGQQKKVIQSLRDQLTELEIDIKIIEDINTDLHNKLQKAGVMV